MDGDLSRDLKLRTARALTPSVFHEDWWLQATTDGHYQEATVRAEGRIVGRLPFVCARLAAGHIECGMPELTLFLGPAIDAGCGAPVNRRLRHDGILRDLLAALPATSGFCQMLHRETADTLVFDDEGYRTVVRFSYEVRPGPVPALWAGMRGRTRNAIRRAEERMRCCDLQDPDEFLALYDRHLEERGLVNRYRRIVPLCRAALLRDRLRILATVDGSGRTVAAIAYVWDERAAYYLLATRSLFAGKGAVALLVWRAIQDAAGRGLAFDFAGIDTPGTMIFASGFGGQVVPRYMVARYSLGHRIVGGLRQRLGFSGVQPGPFLLVA